VLFLARRNTVRVLILRLAQGDGATQVASAELNPNAVSRAQPIATLVLKFYRQ